MGDKLIRREEDVDLQSDGSFDYRFVKIFDNEQLTFAETFDRIKKQVTRSYYDQGRIMVQEGDSNADSFFETMILFGSNEEPIQAFERQKDGTVAQFSYSKLAELKRAFAVTRLEEHK